MAIQIKQPFEMFFNKDGSPLNDGNVYIGIAGLNPETNPISIFSDSSMSIPVAQPLKTTNGYISINGSARDIFAQGDYSITVKDKNGVLMYSSLTNNEDGIVSYVDNVSDLANFGNTNTSSPIIVKDLDRGGTFIWSATGTANGGTVFAGATGYWNRQYSGAVNVKWFGAKGDGVTDDTTSIQSSVNYIKENGGILKLEKGIFLIDYILISTATKSFTIQGAGRGQTILKRRADTATSVIQGTSIGSKVIIEDLSIDGSNSAFPNGNHGIAIGDTSGVRINRVDVYNYKNSSIIFYASTINTYVDCVATDCISDGMNVANNGMLCADIHESGFINCKALNVGKLGSPCYGLQTKNTCQDCFIINSYTSGATIGIAMGNYEILGDQKNNRVVGCMVYNCDSGLAFGKSIGNLVEGLIIDMNNSGLNAVDFNTNSVGNTVRGIVIKNIANNKMAVNFRDGDTANVAIIDTIENSSGIAGVRFNFSLNSLRNTVILNRFVNPTSISSSSSLVLDSSLGGTNTFQYMPLPNKKTVVIATGTISIVDNKTAILAVDTEGAAATDDLTTINNGIDGQTLILSTISNARDVVVIHNTGNILLNGSVNCTLDAAADTLTLMYNSALSKWVEISRSNNT